MKPQEIKEIIERLDAGIPKENARVSIQKYGEDLEEVFVVATRNGYLRLGVELLKAAIAPHVPPEKTLGKRPHAVEVEVDYLFTEDSDVRLDYFERNEEVRVKMHEETLADRVIPFALLGAMIFILALALVGLAALVRKLF